MKRLASFAGLWLAIAVAVGGENLATTNAPPAAATNVAAAVPPVDPMAEAIAFLRDKYVDFPALKYKPGDKLADLLARSNGGIYLLPAAGPIVTATLPGGILYWRLASFTPGKDWTELAAQLRADGLIGVVLDLRSSTAVDDSGGEAQLLSLLQPAGSPSAAPASKDIAPLVTVPAASLPMAVLVDSRTAGTAEAFAEKLKAGGALVIGEPTAGRGIAFAQLQLASGQALLAQSSSPPPDHPRLQPDIALPVDEWSEQASLSQIKDARVADVVQESAPRHRMSEAALVQGQDPEWDAYLESMKKKPGDHFLLSLPPLHDAALVTAMDALKAIRITQAPAPVTAKPEAPTPSASLQ